MYQSASDMKTVEHNNVYDKLGEKMEHEKGQYLKLIQVVNTSNIAPWNFKDNKAMQGPMQLIAEKQRIA